MALQEALGEGLKECEENVIRTGREVTPVNSSRV